MADGKVPCPGCRTPMAVERSRGVEIDRCVACRGIWFDAGELATSLGKPLPPVEPKGPSSRGCPRCGTALGLAKMGRVEVDVCGTCTGVYLDAGELSRLTPVELPRPGRSVRHRQTAAGAGGATDLLSTVLSILQFLP